MTLNGSMPERAASEPGNFDTALRSTVRAAADWLIASQKPDGHWVGRAETNACMEAQWSWRCGSWGSRTIPCADAWDRRCWIRSAPMAPGRSITAPRTATSMRRSRPMPRCARLAFATRSRSLPARASGSRPKGGLRNVRVFTRYWLALIGEWPWEKTPNIPPEVIWFPVWFPFSIYNFAQWARATLMPIAVLSARRPSRPLPPREPAGRAVPRGTRRVRLRAAGQTRCRRLGQVLPPAPTRFCMRCRTSATRSTLACFARQRPAACWNG